MHALQHVMHALWHPMHALQDVMHAICLFALQEWLMDRRGRDQFVIRYGDETEVCWNDHQKQQAEQVCSLAAAEGFSAHGQQECTHASQWPFAFTKPSRMSVPVKAIQG